MLSDVLTSVHRVAGEMTIAEVVRKRATRTELVDWAGRLRRAAEMMEDAARAH